MTRQSWRKRPGETDGRSGGVALIVGLALVAVLGMGGLALELGAAYLQQGRLQKVADSAAMAGAISWIKSPHSLSALTATISAVVVANGLAITVIQQPTHAYLAYSPKNAANPAIQVSLSAPSSLTLARVFTSADTVTTTAYSVVEIGGSSQSVFLVSLSSLIINSSVASNGCSVAANSITVNGGGTLDARPSPPASINTAGSQILSGGITFGTVNTGATLPLDPYAGYVVPANAFSNNCQNYNNQTTLTPGCWTNVNLGTAVTLSQGTYFFSGMNMNAGSSLIGTGGVTIVLQSAFSPNGNITITAPTTGAWAGMAIYAIGGINFNSNVSYNISGTVYAPTSTLNLDAGTWNANACTSVIAQNITFNSQSKFTLPQANCGFYGFPTPGTGSGSSIALVQ